MVNRCDKDGKPLFSWLVELLPELDRKNIFDRLNKDESWDSSNDAEVLNLCIIPEFRCPSAKPTKNRFSANYVAIIGPGTIWREEGTVSMKDIADPSVVIMAIECADSEKHWAAPYSLTAEDVLERLKTGQGMCISSAHPSVINVLFADGRVVGIRSDMPISQWRKLLMGQIKKGRNWNAGRTIPTTRPQSIFILKRNGLLRASGRIGVRFPCG